MKILVTGGTGFVGRSLVRKLIDDGHSVRLLIRPSLSSPNLPKGLPVEVAVSGLHDSRGLAAAMAGVETVIHLAGVERRGTRDDLLNVDVEGTRMVLGAAKSAKVEKLIYLSHLGANRASAFPNLKVKGIAEELIRQSGIDYLILRSAILFGQNDAFTTGLAQLLSIIPFVFFVPGDGQSLLQPLWVEDLTTALVWSLERNDMLNQVLEVGGPEYFSFSAIVDIVARAINVKKNKIKLGFPYLRALTMVLENTFPYTPISVYWLDYLGADRTCSLDSMPRLFNLLPSRMNQRLGYLEGRNWRRIFWSQLLRKSARDGK